jgi:transcriptional regulator with XRE-family HTH domain
MRERIRKDHKRKPHPVDVIAGRNLKLARSRAGFSQERLGRAVGLTFQQIQKYERGANRMSLSRAADFAAVLGISVSEFFDQPPAGSARVAGSGYSRWIALYQKALDAGIATEICRITGAIISLRGGCETRGA